MFELDHGVSPHPTHKPLLDHVTKAYARVCTLVGALRMEKFQLPGNRPTRPWHYNGPLIVVKEVVYTHLNQTVLITSRKPTILKVEPDLVSFAENEDRMRSMFGELQDGVFFIGDAPAGRMPGDSKYHKGLMFCALCCINNFPGRKACPSIAAVPVPASAGVGVRSASCYRCNIFRRPCCWFNPPPSRTEGFPDPRFRFLTHWRLDIQVMDMPGPFLEDLATELEEDDGGNGDEAEQTEGQQAVTSKKGRGQKRA